MNHPFNRRHFIVGTTATAAAVAFSQRAAANERGHRHDALFAYGVASGDPLADRVILWTHAKHPRHDKPVELKWQVAHDSHFRHIIRHGHAVARKAHGHTVKVDVDGLSAGSSYFFRFLADDEVTSPVGRTRTLPASNVAEVKLAVFSCALYSEGFFNAYDDATVSGAQYAIHLGDYIYEYGAGADEFGNADIPGNRITKPAHDIVSLDDYRTRYALYRTDPDLQALHAAMPFITVWDDHEFANNAWTGGAENHDPATRGDWAVRKANAARAYHEWMPIRTQDPHNLLRIYRSFDFGSLLSLHMLDTRIEGRDRQYDNF
ncbi:MAG: hypothetical protein RL375_739, partial [Pseudomonadota bacterium]